MRSYRFAAAEDRSALFEIWREAFPSDTVEDIAAFLERITPEKDCLLALEDGVPVSMVFMLPATLRVRTVSYRLQYIYAAATKTEFRGRGIFAHLLKQAFAVAVERGCDGSFLRPASPSLFTYYARFGYEPFFYCHTLHGLAKAAPLTLNSLSAQAYAARRLALSEATVVWEPCFVEYSMGEAVKISAEKQQGLSLYSKRGNTLYIAELLGFGASSGRIAAALAAQNGCDTFTARIPATDKTECFGLLKPFKTIPMPTDKIPFMGLALD